MSQNDSGSGEDYLEMTTSGMWNDSTSHYLCEFQHLYTTSSAINVTETSIVNHHALVLVFNNGQSNVTFDVGYGAAFSLLPVPQRDGFQFDGWYFENSENNFANPATDQNKTDSTQTLYAKWGPIQHPITYILGAGLTASDTYITDDTKTLTVHTRAGFTFEGYYDNATFTGNSVTILSSGNFGAKTYYAKFLPITYQINYVLTNRAITTTIFLDDLLFETFTPEFDDFEIAIPYAVGYTFKEWRLNSVTGAVVTSVQKGTTFDLHLIGIWDVIHYPIEYDLLAGLRFNTDSSRYTMSHPNPLTYTIENPLTFQNATVAGYQFNGWKNISGTAVTDIPLGQIGAVSLVATWAPITYTLTFDVAGGNTIDPLNAPFESDITLPSANRPGYRFDGWFENGVRVDYELMPLNNRTLEARWTALPYTLTFVNSITNEQTTLTADFNAPIQMPQIIEPGYFFGGWLENNRPVRFTTMPLGNRTLVASFNPRSFTISFSSELGTVPAAISAPYRSSVNLPILTAEHFTFKGWQGPSGLIQGSFEVPLNGATLNAVFEPKLYTLSFTGPAGVQISPLEFEYNQALTLPNPTLEGYRFTGWYLDGEPFTQTQMPGENITLEARFERAEVTLRLISDNQLIRESRLIVGDAFTLPTVAKLGYTFMGWYEGNTRVLAGAMPARNMTLEARLLINSYNVTYVSEAPQVIRTEFNSAVQLPILEKTGYRFLGWQYQGQMIDSLVMPAQPIELNAIFRPLNLKITFATPSQVLEMSITTDVELSGLNPLSVPSEYVWLGYFTQPFGGGDSLNDGLPVDDAHSLRIYPYYLRAGQTFNSSTRRLSTDPYYFGDFEPIVEETIGVPWLELISFFTVSVTIITIYVGSKKANHPV